MKIYKCKCFRKDLKSIKKKCKKDYLKEVLREVKIFLFSQKILSYKFVLTEIEDFLIMKIRLEDCQKKGKRGGFRVIFAFNKEEKILILIRIYDKSKIENLSVNQIVEDLKSCLMGDIEEI